MTDHLVYIGIGSNLEDPLSQVRRAIEQLAALIQSKLISRSSLYASKPMGSVEQPDYINAVVSIKTSLSALDLLDELQQIETEHGRVRSGPRWGSRTLDLDILLYGEKTINSVSLRIPHPGLHERAFVLYPLYEINPELMIPGKANVAVLKENCPADGLKIITV